MEGEEVKDDKEEYYQEGIRPGMFKSLIGKGHEEFQSGRQQDAREYFSYLLEKMVLGEKKIGSNQNPSDLFNFEMEQRIQCTKCNCVKYNKQKEQCLMLTIPVDSKVEKGTPVELGACLEATFSESLVEDFNCPKCQEKTVVKDRKRFITYPTCLAFALKRIVYTDWVPAKLEIELVLGKDDIVDLTPYVGVNAELQEGEEGFPQAEEPDEIEPELDQGMVNTLIQNGVPEIAAKHAVYNAGGSADEAIMWFYGNIENPAIQVPLLVPNTKKGQAAGGDSGFVPNAEALQMLMCMGFDEKLSTRALRKCDNNLERASDWVMSHMDEPDSEDEAKGAAMEVDSNVPNAFDNSTPDEGVYQLQSFTTHLGSSLGAGHYVAHVRYADEEGKWIYYNDDKVAKMDDPPIGKGYLYFLRKP